VLTYAEIHYRPRFVPSLIFNRWPEIVCDAPTRVEPNRPVPVFIIIKDAHRYPVQLEMVAVHVLYEGGIERIAQFPYDGIAVNEQIWWDSINIMPEYPGEISISVNILVRKGKKLLKVNIDNYSGTTHKPLSVYSAEFPLPCADGWYQGDIHCHTFFTSDQVEFGAPVEVMAFAAYCMGLHWLAATDHSYDLDDRIDDYMMEDPSLAKWQMMKDQVKLLWPTATVIPGEEVTCRTGDGKNCHMLALNSERFIKGSGDSGEKGLQNSTENSVGEAVRKCVEWNGMACASHPLEKAPFLERVLLARGRWTQNDLETPGLTGLQFYNGIRDSGFAEGMKTWIQLLLKGRRSYAYGGSDAHGDMNRRRRVLMPFLMTGEDVSHTFGSVRTLVRAASKKTEDIMDGLTNGHAQVTDGPFVDLCIDCENSTAGPGDEISAPGGIVRAVLKSSPEFGSLQSGRIVGGAVGNTEERTIAAIKNSDTGYEHRLESNENISEFSYIRAECETVNGKYCFTNPVWIKNRQG